MRTESLTKYLAGIVLLVGLLFIPAEKCLGYIIPAEQLVGFMAKNFSKFRTLLIIQSTQQEDEKSEGGEESFMEKIWMESPDRVRSQVMDHPMGRINKPDMRYRQILMANNAQRLLQLLSQMGVNTHSVAFTRIDDIIAYRIGDKEPHRPKILVEKDKFLPLFLVYRSTEQSHGRMKVDGSDSWRAPFPCCRKTHARSRGSPDQAHGRLSVGVTVFRGSLQVVSGARR